MPTRQAAGPASGAGCPRLKYRRRSRPRQGRRIDDGGLFLSLGRDRRFGLQVPCRAAKAGERLVDFAATVHALPRSGVPVPGRPRSEIGTARESVNRGLAATVDKPRRPVDIVDSHICRSYLAPGK